MTFLSHLDVSRLDSRLDVRDKNYFHTAAKQVFIFILYISSACLAQCLCGRLVWLESANRQLRPPHES